MHLVALQVDESKDVTNMAQLLVFVRFDYNEEVIEEFFFSKPLESNTAAELSFKLIDENVLKVGIPWSKCISLCTDGAKPMSGKLTGLAAKMRGVAPEFESTHCVIHREALAAKDMPEHLHSVLLDAIKVINFKKTRALNTRLFSP